MPAPLSLTPLSNTITLARSLWTFYITNLSVSHGLYYHVSGTTSERYLENHHSYLTKISNLVILRLHIYLEKLETYSDIFSFGDPGYLSILSPYIIHWVSPCSFQEPHSSFSWLPQACWKQFRSVHKSLCLGMCMCLCVHVHEMFLGRDKVKKEELFLCADRKTKIIYNWLHHHMLTGWHLFWLFSSIHLKSFEFTGQWREIRKWPTLDSDQRTHFKVVVLMCVHCSDELRKHLL